MALEQFPWQRSNEKRKSFGKDKCLKIFRRDQYLDRYSGSRLVFPGALLALGILMPEQFPMHPTWKAGESHDIFWEYWPVVDHVYPVSRGGTNADENLVTTSGRNNTLKDNATLQELGWTLQPISTGETGWDGMVGWFKQIIQATPALLNNVTLRRWNDAVQKVPANNGDIPGSGVIVVNSAST